MIDLFQDYENIPNDIQNILDKYSEDFEDGNYEGLSMALQEVRDRGYTFEYYVNGDAYGLRPIGVPLNELEGYEDEFSEFDSSIEKRVAEEYVDTELMERLKKEWKDKNKYAGGGTIFKKYPKIKNKVVINLGIKASDYNLEKSEMPKTTVGVGISANKQIDLPYNNFDLYIINDEIVLLLNQNGQLRIRVNSEKGKYTLEDVINLIKKTTIEYLKDRNKYAGGGGVDWYDFDKKMALINLNQINEYAIKLDNIVTEDTELEEWVKMKLTRVEQNVADVKKSLEGWEKFEEFGDGGRIFKKQLLHIAKYSKDLIAMIKLGSKLMSWQENKLAVSAEYIDAVYHHLDYEMGNRASDMKFAGGGGVKFERVTSMEDAVISFLTKSNNFNYTNVSVNHSQGVSFLFQYGTLIAKKDGNNVFISDKKYSATTSKLQNLIKSIAQTKGFKVMETEFFDEGGGLDKMKIGKYQINTETFEVSDENGDIVYTGRTLLKAKKWANDESKYDKDVVFEDNSLEITKDALGNLHFDFDRRRNTGWAFDTDDLGVAVAIITKSSFAKEEAIRNIEINSRQLRDSDRKQIVYWLSGGNTEWRFGETYNKSFDETYDEIFDDVALQIKKLMQKEKTIGGLIDLFKKYDTDYFIDYAQGEGSWGEYIFDEDYEREKEMEEELAKYEVGEDYAKEYILDNYNYKSREEILNDLINHFEQEDIEYDEDRINDIIKETFESVDKQTLSLFRHGGGVEISKNQLEKMVGKKLDGWNDDIVYYSGKKYQKCYLRPYYKVC